MQIDLVVPDGWRLRRRCRGGRKKLVGIEVRTTARQSGACKAYGSFLMPPTGVRSPLNGSSRFRLCLAHQGRPAKRSEEKITQGDDEAPLQPGHWAVQLNGLTAAAMQITATTPRVAAVAAAVRALGRIFTPKRSAFVVVTILGTRCRLADCHAAWVRKKRNDQGHSQGGLGRLLARCDGRSREILCGARPARTRKLQRAWFCR